jgi:diguanylate cyclase (GGDEF)-like protein
LGRPPVQTGASDQSQARTRGIASEEMSFDQFTLVTTTALVSTMLSVVAFLACWADGRKALLRPLAWGSALAAAAALVRGLNGVLPDPIPIVGGNALLLLAFGLLWQAVCGLGHRRLSALAVAAGAILWVAACLFPPFYASTVARIVAASAGVAVYTVLSVLELWAGQKEPLRSRWMMITAGVGHTLFHVIRIVFVAYLPFPLGTAPQDQNWTAVLAFEGIIYGMMTMCSLLLMDRERAELQQRRVADLDPLTGVSNRRAFRTAAMNILARKAAGASVAVLLFDLDHFKRINDTFGHAVGDEILVRFARTAKGALGSHAGFGRLGGEEFAGIIVCDGEQAACAVAEQVRAAFATTGSTLDGRKPVGTVSIGVSIIPSGGSVEATLAVADQALYEAKRLGRNRVAYQEAPPSVSPIWRVHAF